MSLRHFRNKPPWFRRKVDESLPGYIRRFLSNVVTMYPNARIYGLRYYWDHDYRMYCKWKKCKRKELSIRKKREGRYFRKHRWEIKQQLIDRDGQLCNHCREPFEWRQLTFDHIIRLEDGGTSVLENLQLLCVPCHEAKTQQEHLLLKEIKLLSATPTK
ncbi:HNH endonuclease [Mucilaginibacter gracilis]|uniref:HNH endonuclease n=1 Tax=Mucilaginibacter gracilis TaxID=423350 RepID=A0A495IT67_9SPHI|nr:HNH endonuclease signature motif containing protein [Mucilaginibacter gracilis]RKR79976.1 HNH endonuclease [Mucilaginibacter gracilis]